ncbi:MAG: aminomethyl-transferring glycine dehydrogenase subunit GcvPB [Deltaproteobacteria bacterium]|nr:MAG: aminomethyl-transferring glycine dehydrogenase subunit GcvPB [Deltaproteobacteria bacterium]
MSAEHGLQFAEPPIFERGAAGRSGASLPQLDVPRTDAVSYFGPLARRQPAALPEVSEPEAVRHFVRLSQANFSIDTQMYPLGSCTMKYNPKVNEWAARQPGFVHLHPLVPDRLAQGSLELMWRLERMLIEITGFHDCSMQPAAGAQGELTGLMMIRAYHRAQGRSPRKVLIPESAHGTNPASCSLSGLDSVKLPVSSDGLVHPEQVAAAIDQVGADDVCALMVTNPNTLGLFESWLPEIAGQIHDCGGLVYGDGANTNAIMGRVRPGDIGVDVVHLNLHKTFSTPHGAGGPGSGPVCFTEALAPFQPIPVLKRQAGRLELTTDRPQSIGRMRAFHGNVGVFVRAYCYIRELGAQGLEEATNLAVLNARYLWAQLKDLLPPASELPCMHEVVFSDAALEKATGVKTLDVAKRLLDYGFHAPTVYFPLVVKGALMIEPTETETKQTLDELVAALREILNEAEHNPDKVKTAPHKTRVGRLDEAAAARKPRLRWSPTATG